MGNPSADRKKQKEKRHKKMMKRLYDKAVAAEANAVPAATEPAKAAVHPSVPGAK